MKALYLSEQDVEQLLADYRVHYDEKSSDDSLHVDVEKEFDDDGRIVGVRFNLADESGNIVTGYQETFGVYGDSFGDVDMQDGDGGTQYVTRRSDIPQLN